MKGPILVVLAAGMGSRYGGLKQMDELGKNGEVLLDYSVYDAIHSGFEKVVFHPLFLSSSLPLRVLCASA